MGKAPIKISKEIAIKIEGRQVVITGPKGELTHPLPPGVEVVIKDDQLLVNSENQALWGTTRALLNNMVEGVIKGHTKKLTLHGVGYRVQVSKTPKGCSRVDLTLGLSHPVYYEAPKGIELQSAVQTEIVVSGICKELVGQVAANIRGIRKGVREPEPYKGKGIRYSDERILLKETKKKK